MRSLLQHFQKQRLHHVCFSPFFPCRVLVIKLVFNKHSLLWFFPWGCAGFSFTSIFSGIFLISLRLSFLDLGDAESVPFARPGPPGSLLSLWRVSRMLWVVFPEQRALAAAQLCVPSGSPDGQSNRKGEMASGVSNPNARQSELLSESDLSAGVWEHTSWKERGSMSNPRKSQIIIIQKGGPLQWKTWEPLPMLPGAALYSEKRTIMSVRMCWHRDPPTDPAKL